VAEVVVVQTQAVLVEQVVMEAAVQVVMEVQQQLEQLEQQTLVAEAAAAVQVKIVEQVVVALLY
tara:strand:- start:132 stop:323 length:192 start_codon:yes stop_codon:yes gene_type:complete